jgi:hypothetical protein
MFKSLALKGLRLIVLCILFFCVQAFAQFEVSPDHFESSTSHNSGSKKTQAKRSPTAQVGPGVPAIAGTSTPRDQQSGGPSASRMAHRRPSRRSFQPGLKQNQVAAVRRKRVDEKQNVAVSP